MQERRTGRGGRGDITVREQITGRQASAPETLKEQESPDKTKGTLRSPHEGAKMKVTSGRNPGNKNTQRQSSMGEGMFKGESLQEQKRIVAETTGIRSTQQQEYPRENEKRSLPEKRDPATQVNEVRGKETKGSLNVKETRGTQNGRDGEEKKVKEYYSNDTEKAESSQGLDKRQGKKLQEGRKEIVGSTALQGHRLNLRPRATGAEERDQQGVSKPRAAKNKAVPKATVETE